MLLFTTLYGGGNAHLLKSLTKADFDKGIIITTGSFTSDAKREAKRDGAPPIELVDGEKLVIMFEKLGLGVVPKTVFEVDEGF